MTGKRKSRTYAERAAAGRPLVTFSLTTETKDLLTRLADHEGTSRSAVLSEAVRAYARRRKLAA